MLSTPGTAETTVATATKSGTVLDISELSVEFATVGGRVEAVSNVSLAIASGQTLGVVGESGSGKSQLFLAVMGLLAENGCCTGSARFRGQQLIGIRPRELNAIRGGHMSMVFQDPMTSLNPYLRVSTQLTEVLIRHRGMTASEALRRATSMLEQVRIPEAARRVHMYPHEFSGGMRQRVMIAMALLCEPGLLIADEPTTALDVTIQAQILDLLRDLHKHTSTAIVLITHDLGVVAGLCDRVMVMYAGRIVESAPVDILFSRPQHPYTRGLLASSPRLDQSGHGRLPTIRGQPPDLQALPAGCAFAPRCDHAWDRCRQTRPQLRDIGPGHMKRCHLQEH